MYTSYIVCAQVLTKPGIPEDSRKVPGSTAGSMNLMNGSYPGVQNTRHLRLTRARSYDSQLPSPPAMCTPNLCTNIMELRRFDSSKILISRCAIPRPIGNVPESLSQAILVGIMLVGKLCVALCQVRHQRRQRCTAFAPTLVTRILTEAFGSSLRSVALLRQRAMPASDVSIRRPGRAELPMDKRLE